MQIAKVVRRNSDKPRRSRMCVMCEPSARNVTWLDTGRGQGTTPTKRRTTSSWGRGKTVGRGGGVAEAEGCWKTSARDRGWDSSVCFDWVTNFSIGHSILDADIDGDRQQKEAAEKMKKMEAQVVADETLSIYMNLMNEITSGLISPVSTASQAPSYDESRNRLLSIGFRSWKQHIRE